MACGNFPSRINIEYPILRLDRTWLSQLSLLSEINATCRQSEPQAVEKFHMVTWLKEVRCRVCLVQRETENFKGSPAKL